MNTPLNNSERIVSLLDGELSPDATSQLYLDLASDIDLQEEMNQHLSLKNVLNKNIITPPSSLKANITSNLSIYSVPWYLNKYLNSLAFVLLGGIISFFIFDSIDNTQEYKISKSENQTPTQNISPLSFSIELPSEKEAEPSANNIYIEKENTENFKADTDSYLAKTNSKTESKKYYSEMLDISIVSPLSPVNLMPQTEINRLNPNNLSLNEYNAIQSYGLSFEIKGFKDYSLTNVKVSPTLNPSFNDMSIAILYNFNNNWQVGLEYGQEYFNQRFYSSEGFIQNFTDQIYLSNWLGFSGKYITNNYNTYFTPQLYGKALAAFSEAGPILKTESGIIFNFSDRLSFFTGLQFTNLTYSYKSNLFNSSKFGLSGGFNVKF